MQNNISNRIKEYTEANSKKKIWQKVLIVLSCIVVFCTTYALILPAITMSKKPICGFEEHVHDHSCYETVVAKEKLDCKFKVHTHSESCYGEDGSIICGCADYIIHEHDENCYEENGTLACTFPEIKEHKHSSSCYEEETEDVCTLAESEGHRHTKDCYDENEELTCTLEETDGHVHSEDCKKIETKLVCNENEVVFHRHTDECYTDEKLTCGKIEVLRHNHDENCFAESATENKLICTKPEHQHDEFKCYPEEETESEYLCGLGEHIHSDDCIDDDGNIVCNIPEHEHNETCKETKQNSRNDDDEAAAFLRNFNYEDSELSMVVKVGSKEKLSNSVKLEVSPLNKNSTDYKKYIEFNKKDGGNDKIIAKSIVLTENGKEIDPSILSVTAEVTLKDAVLKPIKKELGLLKDAAPEAEMGIVLSSFSKDENSTVSAAESAVISVDEKAPTLTVPVQSKTLALAAAPSANPTYKVQYYANIDRFATSGDVSFDVFDTRKSNGGALPKNSTTNKMTNVYLKDTGSYTTSNNGDKTKIYNFKTTKVLTEIFSSESFQYIKAPNTMYMDKLSENKNYSLKEVWVLKDGKSETSMNKADWTVYTDPSSIHFTNRRAAAKDNVLYITDSTRIRLVYKITAEQYDNTATFYDYDITNGYDSGRSRWLSGTAGINSSTNYGTSRNGARTWGSHCDVLAFGNANCGTGMGHWKFDGLALNAHSGNKTNKGCNFGLASSLSNGKIVYNEWIVAPRLFNDGNAKGKTTYENSKLTFKREGDTYSLTSATVSGVGTINNLNGFFNPSPTSGKVYTNIYTNSFWPLDRATKCTDPKFGKYNNGVPFFGYADNDGTNFQNVGTINGTFPVSDDGKVHNSFFGMHSVIEFNITSDYVGPLEYFFYGDDDLWVFLDNKLICDVGGVHSSVGEIVDLWDYLKKGVAGKHTLTIFYTERGASGSSCYMQFTLPNVSGKNIEQTTDDLTVKKTVIDGNGTDEFKFRIRFYDKDGNTILDDYAYTKYNADATAAEDEIIVCDGDTFTLKDGQYIIIKNLPLGIKYKISEMTPANYTVTSTVNGVTSVSKEAGGSVLKNQNNFVQFTNTGSSSAGFTLKKVDQDGKPLSGAVFTVADSSKNLIEFLKKDSGSYIAANNAGAKITSGEDYYIIPVSATNLALGKRSTGSNGVYVAETQTNTGSDAHKFTITKTDDGYYTVLCKQGGYLELKDNALEAGTAINVTDGSTVVESRKWAFEKNNNGTYRIRPMGAAENNMALSIEQWNCPAKPGEKVDLCDDKTEANLKEFQEWYVVPVSDIQTPTESTRWLSVSESGMLTVRGLKAGTYTLTETAAPNGCELLSEPITVTIDKNSKLTLVSNSELVTLDSTGAVINVKNNYLKKTLTLQKEVKSLDSDDISGERQYSFNVFWEANGKTDSQVINVLPGSGNAKTISNIPYGAKVTITETSENGFSVEYYQGNTLIESGSVCVIPSLTEDVLIKCVNTANRTLKIKKFVNSVSEYDSNNPFTFEVSFKDIDGGTKIETLDVRNGTSETLSQIPHGAVVTVREVNARDFVASYVSNGTQLKSNEDGSVTFTMDNDVLITATNNVEMTIKKVVSGGELENDSKKKYTFNISWIDQNGQTQTEECLVSTEEPYVLKTVPYGAIVTVEESQIPDGYTVSFEKDGTVIPLNPDKHSFTFEMNGNVTITATNTLVGYILPETGGSGTFWYTIGGLLLIAGSLLLGIGLRRKKERRFS